MGQAWQTRFGIFRHGQCRPDGFYFNGISNGHELWISPKTWRKRHSVEAMRLQHKHLMKRLQDPQECARFRKNRRRIRIVNLARYLWSSAKFRSKRLGIAFEIEVTDITVPKYCPVLGMRLRSRKGGVPRANSPSLDRIDPDKGYVKGNVIVVSWLANRIKSDATPDQILAVGRFYKKLIR